MRPLAPRDRSLLHLLDTRGHLLPDSPRSEMTQGGISSALGIERTHVTRLMRPLVQEGLVAAKKRHIAQKDRKLTFYSLTEAGLERAREVVRSFGDESVDLVAASGSIIRMKVSEGIRTNPHLGALAVIDAAASGTPLKVPGERLVYSNSEIKEIEIVGRSEQLKVSADFIESEATVIAFIAPYGYGSSTLMRWLALKQWTGPLFWYDLSKDGSAGAANAALTLFGQRMNCPEWLDLKDRPVLLCFDNYRAPQEDLVDLMHDLVRDFNGGRAKIAVAMGSETPSYGRFYQRKEVEEGQVWEVSMHRLDEGSARQLLRCKADDETFRQIYRLTQGQPLALDLVRRGDLEGLSKIREGEEARFLMYLREKCYTR